jgi:hypothetical protein
MIVPFAWELINGKSPVLMAQKEEQSGSTLPYYPFWISGSTPAWRVGVNVRLADCMQTVTRD